MPVTVAIAPTILGALHCLAVLSCRHSEGLFGVVAEAFVQCPGYWRPQLKDFLYRHITQTAHRKDVTTFLSSFPVSSWSLCVPKVRSSSDGLPNPLVRAHGATLKVLIWQLRSSRYDDDDPEYSSLQEDQFDCIHKRCPLLEEIGVIINWRQRYLVSTR